MREDGKAVKMVFWVVEKEQDNLSSSAYLPVLNRLPSTALAASRKAQDEGEHLPMHRNTTKPKEPGDITSARRAPVRRKTSISNIYYNEWNSRNTLVLAYGALFYMIVVTITLFPYCESRHLLKGVECAASAE